MSSWFVYLDEIYYDSVDPVGEWEKIKCYLISILGSPFDHRTKNVDSFSDASSRWSESLMRSYGGIPRGIYFKFEEDLVVFRLKYQNINIREKVQSIPYQ